MLALQTAYGLTFFPDLRLTLVTHLSNFFVSSPFFTPLGINYISLTSFIKITTILVGGDKPTNRTPKEDSDANSLKLVCS